MDELWVFAYGSLMWRPGFEYTAVQGATLAGYRRCLCLYSVHHRGDAARPGLVLGLDRGGVCQGLAFRVDGGLRSDVLANLRAREQVTGAYRETFVPVVLSDGRHVQAVTYIAERAHPGYAERRPLAVQARFVRAARGRSGANVDYLVNTLHILARLAIRDRDLERVMVLIGATFSRGPDRERQMRSRGLVAALRGRPLPKLPPRRGDLRRFFHRQMVKPAWSTRAR